VWRDPFAGFACLEKMQALQLEAPSTIRSSTATSVGISAGTPVIVTDAAWVAECAAANGIATTGADAVHPAPIGLAWPHNYRTADLDKYILEWWLMWQARRGGTLAPDSYPGGLLMTARYGSSGGDGPGPSASESFPVGCNRTEERSHRLNLARPCSIPVLAPARHRQLGTMTSESIYDKVMARSLVSALSGMPPIR
jgi:hypothetical protein